jgi:hypothetical protein
MEDSLRELSSLGLIDIETGIKTHDNGWKIPIFVLKEVNWYINYNIMDFKTEEPVWDRDTTK